MLLEASFEVGGDAGVEGGVGAFEDVDEVHSSILLPLWKLIE